MPVRKKTDVLNPETDKLNFSEKQQRMYLARKKDELNFARKKPKRERERESYAGPEKDECT